jgi:hypothetical protein
MVAMKARTGNARIYSAQSRIPEFGDVGEIFNPGAPI